MNRAVIANRMKAGQTTLSHEKRRLTMNMIAPTTQAVGYPDGTSRSAVMLKAPFKEVCQVKTSVEQFWGTGAEQRESNTVPALQFRDKTSHLVSDLIGGSTTSKLVLPWN